MSPQTLAAILASQKQFDEFFGTTLASSAAKAYAAGLVTGMKDAKIVPNAQVVLKEAKAYGQKYGDLLKTEGASIINGEKVPWVADRSTEQRDKIQQIINDGIKEGKATGVKEKKSGSYPEGTIAHDLESYFSDRKSQASTVARTEVGRIQSESKFDAWERHGYEEVNVLDGTDDDDACKEANGSTWTIEYARLHTKEHPNCRRTFTPVIKGFKKREAVPLVYRTITPDDGKKFAEGYK